MVKVNQSSLWDLVLGGLVCFNYIICDNLGTGCVKMRQ